MEAAADRVRWRGAMVAAAVVVPCALVLATEIRQLWSLALSTLVFAPTMFFAGSYFLFGAVLHPRMRGKLSSLATMLVFWGVAPLTFYVWIGPGQAVSDRIAWVWSGEDYRRQVLAQPERPGEIRHVEWDGWGISGLETIVYLAFDPTDTLATPVASIPDGVRPYIPCPAASIDRLARSWFLVTMYTETGWDACEEEPRVLPKESGRG